MLRYTISRMTYQRLYSHQRLKLVDTAITANADIADIGGVSQARMAQVRAGAVVRME